MSHPLTAKNWRAGAGRKGEENGQAMCQLWLPKEGDQTQSEIATLLRLNPAN